MDVEARSHFVRDDGLWLENSLDYFKLSVTRD